MPHVHNALHHFTRGQAAYRAALGEGDAGFSGLERAGETVTPVLDLWSLPEWALLRGDVLYSRKVAAPAVAARFASAELVNGSTTSRLVVVEFIRLTSGTGSAVNVGVDSGAAIAANPVTSRGVPCDTRFNQLGDVSACTLVTGDVAATVALPQEELEVATPIPSANKYVLRPGTKLFLIAAVVNQAVGFALSWRERLASDEELARFGS